MTGRTPSPSALPIVGVLDDDADLGATVARLLSRHGMSARSFVRPQDLLEELTVCPFSCVVSDVQMGEMDGFAFADALRERDPAVALVFMTAWPTTAHAVDAIRCYGGLDYLEKPIDEPRLISAVQEGLEWSVRERRIGVLVSAFTRREREVFDLLVRGHSNKEIAERLAISVRTVEDHRASIINKTGVSSLSQLMALGQGEDIVG